MPGNVDGRRRPTPRTRCCSRDEVARLLRAAYRGRRAEGGRGQTVHLARLILVAYYTCTPASVIERASFERAEGCRGSTSSAACFTAGPWRTTRASRLARATPNRS